MLPRWHILFGIIFCAVLYLFDFPIYFLAVIFIATVCIDVDHYIIYIIDKKDFSLARAYKFFTARKKPGKFYFCFFHTIEFFAFIATLAFFNQWFYFAFLGIAFHLALDLIAMLTIRLKGQLIFFSAIARLVKHLKIKNETN